MTKAKAIKLMLEYSRSIVEPTFANKIAKAFGSSLKDLEIKPKKMSEFQIPCAEEVKSLKGVAIEDVAEMLVWKKLNKHVYSGMIGHGSSADDIVEKSVKLLK